MDVDIAAMLEQARNEQQELSEETITCAEELPHLDLQEYIYACARTLYIEHPGQSYHILVVSNAQEQHAELILANGLELEEVKVIGKTIAMRTTRDPYTDAITRRTDRESMEMLLLECKRLLADLTRDPTVMEESIPIVEPPSIRGLREKIFKNARKCFPMVVKDYTSGAITYTFTERDRNYRPVHREIPFTLPESEIFDIAIQVGPKGTLRASLVYGDCQNDDVNFALAGEGRNTHYEAIDALLQATVQRLRYLEEDGRALEGLSRPDAPPPKEVDFDRRDSVTMELGPFPREKDSGVAGE